jgi:predicted component of type VI protein secretion system
MSSAERGRAMNSLDMESAVSLSRSMLRQQRDRLAERIGRPLSADVPAHTWADLRPDFKQMLLRMATLSLLRQCMPWDTFSEADRLKLRDAARQVEQLLDSVRGILR